ncbi:MAG: hypothetical protein M3439_00575 [Chloroflexota bacterium]|nr:hypothetical protein [Chloroflexota bacterium]
MKRWNALAKASDATLTILGTAGWNRVVLGDCSRILEHADLPTELHDSSSVVALSAPVGRGCLALWGEIVHPNTALRARLAPGSIVELSAAVNASYLLVGQIGPSWLAARSSSAIAAELVARGLERLRERLRGLETPGPWEDAGIQHLTGVDQDGLSVADLVVRVRLEDNADGDDARRLGEMLGWRLAFVDDDEAGETGDEG